MMNRMVRNRMKKGLVMVVCMAMLLSLAPTGKVTYATQSSETTTETTTETVAETTTESLSSNNTSNTGNIDPNGTLGKNSDIGVEVTESIKGVAGEKVTIAFRLMSNNVAAIRLKSVYPVIDTSFPFETSGDAYKIIGAANAEQQMVLPASFTMTTRSDIETGYHSVRFIGEYEKTAADGTVQDYYVIKTINIYFSETTIQDEEESDDSKDDSKKDSKDEEEDDSEDESDVSYDEDYDDGGSYSGGSDTEVTAPKLIITGYETKPEKIMAGETFTITIHIQNTSKTTSVCNGKFLVGNEAGSFTPTSGSSAVFVERIAAGETGDIVMEMKAGASLTQKNYSLVVKGDFDDGRGNNFNSSDSLTIPVYQKVSFNISEVSMSPQVLGVGDEGTLMFTINNQSSADVHNVKVSVDDPAVTAEECHIGNITGMSSAYATLMVTGAETNPNSGTIKIIISYEDAEGTVETSEHTVACSVGEVSEYGDEFDMNGEEEYIEYEEEDSYVPVWVYILIGVVVVGVIAGVIVFFVIRRKKKLAEILEAEDGEDDLEDEDF